MRFLVMIRANPDSEAGKPASPALRAGMRKYNEDLAKAGVLLAAEGLLASATGARVVFDRDKRTVVDGPFAETNELIAGFWIFQARSKEEAIEWAKRCPIPSDTPAVIEIRQVAEAPM